MTENANPIIALTSLEAYELNDILSFSLTNARILQNHAHDEGLEIPYNALEKEIRRLEAFSARLKDVLRETDPVNPADKSIAVHLEKKAREAASNA